VAPLRIPPLFSGGVIVTYGCTSRCRHCLVASSPRRERRYMDGAAARSAFRTVREGGCTAVHIGGGEPFLDVEALKAVLAAARAEGVSIDYIETNSSWFHGEASAVRLLGELKRLGAGTLLVSISPFHTEYVPFSRVKGVVAACRRAGVSVFPWVEGFLPDLARMDGEKTHTLEEMALVFGEGYRGEIPGRYWIHWGGRAVLSYRDLLPLRPAGEVSDGPGCREITDTTHFHVDLDGAYIPGLCSGFAIDGTDIGAPLPKDRYPLLSMLHAAGPGTLLAWAVKEHEFVPAAGYVNKCHLCLEIRRHLRCRPDASFPELAPAGFYEEL
jgi:hypothetical protein